MNSVSIIDQYILMSNNFKVTPRFLVIEGPDGVGKTTQLELLREHLISRGVEVVTVREPGGTVVGEKIRDIFKAHFGETDPMTEALMMLAARQQLTEEVIRPALRRGAWVISDRHTPSLFAYQGAGHRLGFSALIALRQGLDRFNFNAHSTAILSLSPEERAARLAARAELDKVDLAGDEFTQRVAGAYAEMTDGTWLLRMGELNKVDASGTPAQVHARILDSYYWHLKDLPQPAYVGEPAGEVVDCE